MLLNIISILAFAVAACSFELRSKVLPHSRVIYHGNVSPAFRLHSTPSTESTDSPRSEELDYNRRYLFQRSARTVFFSFLPAVSGNIKPAGAELDVLRSPGKCVSGEGDGCDSLAGGNELIRSLQKKSMENKETNQREALNAYYMKNYPDVFNVYDKKMVKRASDGSFVLMSAEETKELFTSGKIQIEYPKSKGGKIADLTQKPVLVLVD